MVIQKTLLQIKRRIEEADSINLEKKKELLDLFSILQKEIEKLAGSDRDVAQSIVGFAQTSAHEATRKEKSANLYRLSLDALAASVHGFESSHPRLVETVNSICTTLSNLGI